MESGTRDMSKRGEWKESLLQHQDDEDRPSKRRRVEQRRSSLAGRLVDTLASLFGQAQGTRTIRILEHMAQSGTLVLLLKFIDVHEQPTLQVLSKSLQTKITAIGTRWPRIRIEPAMGIRMVDRILQTDPEADWMQQLARLTKHTRQLRLLGCDRYIVFRQSLARAWKRLVQLFGHTTTDWLVDWHDPCRSPLDADNVAPEQVEALLDTCLEWVQGGQLSPDLQRWGWFEILASAQLGIRQRAFTAYFWHGQRFPHLESLRIRGWGSLQTLVGAKLREVRCDACPPSTWGGFEPKSLPLLEVVHLGYPADEDIPQEAHVVALFHALAKLPRLYDLTFLARASRHVVHLEENDQTSAHVMSDAALAALDACPGLVRLHVCLGDGRDLKEPTVTARRFCKAHPQLQRLWFQGVCDPRHWLASLGEFCPQLHEFWCDGPVDKYRLHEEILSLSQQLVQQPHREAKETTLRAINDLIKNPDNVMDNKALESLLRNCPQLSMVRLEEGRFWPGASDKEATRLLGLATKLEFLVWHVPPDWFLRSSPFDVDWMKLFPQWTFMKRLRVEANPRDRGWDDEALLVIAQCMPHLEQLWLKTQLPDAKQRLLTPSTTSGPLATAAAGLSLGGGIVAGTSSIWLPVGVQTAMSAAQKVVASVPVVTDQGLAALLAHCPRLVLLRVQTWNMALNARVLDKWLGHRATRNLRSVCLVAAQLAWTTTQDEDASGIAQTTRVANDFHEAQPLIAQWQMQWKMRRSVLNLIVLSGEYSNQGEALASDAHVYAKWLDDTLWRPKESQLSVA